MKEKVAFTLISFPEAPAPPPITRLRFEPTKPTLSKTPTTEHALGCIRGIRSHAQSLLKFTRKLREKSELIDSATREKEVRSYLSANEEINFSIHKKIGERLLELDDYQRRNPQIYNWCSDVVASIGDEWLKVKEKWPEKDQALDEILARIAVIVSALKEMILKCGQLSIPPRADDHLRSLRIGQTLDFHDAFKDELDEEKDRKDVLEYIQAHPLALVSGGVVDSKNGVIYRASPNLWRQILSYVLIGLFVILGVGILVFLAMLGSGLDLQDWPIASSRLVELLVAYVFLVAGAFVHIGIDAIKQARRQKESKFSALSNIFLWIHVKEVSIMVGVVSLWIGIVGLAFVVPVVQWQLAFFVGYGIDSFVDIFLQKFETKVSKGIEEAKSI